MISDTHCGKGTLLLKDDPDGIIKAASIISKGGLVAFPTETVYGLGAAATNSRAVKKIYSAKGRPSDNPLIVHVADLCQLEQVAETVPKAAYRLAERFWPGPLSIILPKAGSISGLVSAGLATVAVRMPNHQVALALIKAAGVPIAAPSANRSGRPSPTSYRHVLEDLSGRIDAVIKSTPCQIGIESTVIDLTTNMPVILRPGGITGEEIASFLGCRVDYAQPGRNAPVPLSPGVKYRHYSPRATLILVSGPQSRRRPVIAALVKKYRKQGLKVGLLNAIMPGAADSDGNTFPEVWATHLYSSLREMDRRGMNLIIAEELESQGLGHAVMNRLKKAASRILRVT